MRRDVARRRARDDCRGVRDGDGRGVDVEVVVGEVGHRRRCRRLNVLCTYTCGTAFDDAGVYPKMKRSPCRASCRGGLHVVHHGLVVGLLLQI